MTTTSRLLIALVIAGATAFAQTASTAQINGTVRDSTGLVIPGAAVTVTQTATGAVRNSATGADGGYVLPNLPIGPYTLEVTKDGFSKYVQSGIVLQVAANPTIDAALKVGSVSEQVLVEANAALVETRSTGVGQVIDNTRVVEMPLNGRQVTELILLSGAAIGGLAQTPVGRNYPTDSIAVAGGLSNGLLYLLDGGTHNDPYNNLNLPLPFPDALQEFKVETSALPAQYGQHSAAAVNAVTKSGTNEYHGDLFEFVRNGAMNARNAFALTRDSLKRNQFGGVIGGPIRKNKLFFFAGDQMTYVRSTPSDATTQIPTAAMVAGDFTTVTSTACRASALTLKGGFVNNKIAPSLLSPAAINLVKRLPANTDACGNVHYGLVNNYDEKLIVGRIDYQINEKHSVFGRYMIGDLKQPSSYDGVSVLSLQNADFTTRDQSIVLGDTYLLGATTVNSFRATFLRTLSVKTLPDFFNLGDLGVKGVYYPTNMAKMPQISVSGAFTAGTQPAVPGTGNTEAFQLNEDVSMIRGAHQLGFGASYLRSELNVIALSVAGAQVAFAATNTGLGLGDLMVGKMSTYTQGNPATHYPRQNYLGAYMQDTWKVASRLTVNAGLRWEPFLGQRDKQGRMLHFQPDWYTQGLKSTVYKNAPAGLLFPGDSKIPNDQFIPNALGHFAPRIGLAFDPMGDGKMTIRAAYGIFFDYPHLYQFNGLRDSPPWGTRVVLSNPAGGFDNPFQGYPGGNPFPLVIDANAAFPLSAVIVNLPLNLKMPYINQWNLSVQRQLGTNWLATANYIGSEAVHVLNTAEGNPAIYLPGASCAINGVTYTPCSSTANTIQRRQLSLQNAAQGQYYGAMVNGNDGGTHSYNGLLLSVQRRATKGVSVQANYTWSHCIDDGANTLFQNSGGPTFERRRANRGSCESDRRHIFNLSTVYETPRFSGKALRLLATGWRIGLIGKMVSGQYLTVLSGLDNALTSTTDERPNLVGSSIYPSNQSVNLWIDPAAFAQPALGTYGNFGARNVRAPGNITFNTNITRSFRIGEKRSVEFRAEQFNLVNHMNPLNPAAPAAQLTSMTTLTSSTFGRILSANDPRILQLAMKFVF